MLRPCQPDDPETVGNFHILARLGAGGFGTVFAAHDHDRPDELVAVKVLKSPEGDMGNFAERFSKEIEAIKRVESRYVPAFVGGGVRARAGGGQDSPWLATELVPGLSLHEVVDSYGPLDEATVWQIGSGVTAALEAIRDASLVHRDLKPGNVLITPDGPKIIDFGLVYLAELPHSPTSREWRAGTAQYMPPEVLWGGLHEGKIAGDIFMLGGTLLYAATRHPPFHASAAGTLAPRAARERPDLSDLPDNLVPVVTQCLEYDPARRPTLDSLAREFGRRTRGDQPFAKALPSEVLRLLEIFRRDLAAAVNSCASTVTSPAAVDPFWTRPGRQDPQRDLTAREYTRQDPPTAPYTRNNPSAVGYGPVTVTEQTHRRRPQVIRPLLLDEDTSWDTRDDSWRSVRWACQFGAWIQAPVAVVGRVAVAADLDGTIGGLDALEGGQLWAFGVGAAVRSAAVPLPGRVPEVCLGDADGVVHAIELQSGRHRTLLQAGDAIQGPMAVDGDRVYAVSADGRLYAIDTDLALSTVLFSARDLALCAPAVLTDAIFAVTTQGEVLAIDSFSGGVRWKVPTDGRICAAPLPVRDRLYIAGTDGLLLEVDSLGRVRATADLNSAVHVQLAHDGDRLYAGASDGMVWAFSLDRERGAPLTPLWKSPLGGEITGLAAVGGQVYAAAGDSVLRLDPVRGARALILRMECPVAAAPAASAGLLYTAGLGGTVCCVSLS
jgi:serine/threonine protein kinase/outer membrane protein assembly factor BamB